MQLNIFRVRRNVQKENYVLEPYKRKFISFNSKYWGNTHKSKSSKVFFVEGLLGEMPMHLLRLGISAKAIENSLDIKPVVIFYNEDSRRTEELFESFGISEFVHLADVKLDAKRKFFILQTMLKFSINRDVDSLINIEYKGVNIGKLIYDGILHVEEDCYTIKCVEKRYLKYIQRALEWVVRYDALLERSNVDMVLLSHNVYIEFGTLAVAALCQNKEVITVNETEVSKYSMPQEIYLHTRFHNGIINILKKVDNEKLRMEGKEYLNERITGNSGLFDVKNAFRNKKVYTRRELSEQFSHNNNNNVFIFMHVFSDAPHLSEMNMYKDYYDWIVDTVKIIKKIQNVNWFIKIHPSAYLYGETENIRKILDVDSYNNIFYVPDDFNTASIQETADVIITCQGTVGIEGGCMGIPVIATGKPFYAGFGFTLCPETRSEYYEMLHRCNSLKRLSDENIKMAMAVMGAFNRVKDDDKTIIDDEVCEYGGYGKETDMERTYDKIIKNLDGFLYNEIPLYNKVKELIET